MPDREALTGQSDREQYELENAAGDAGRRALGAQSKREPGTTRYRATVRPPDVRGWTWKQIVMGAADYIGTSIRELADVLRQERGDDE